MSPFLHLSLRFTACLLDHKKGLTALTTRYMVGLHSLSGQSLFLSIQYTSQLIKCYFDSRNLSLGSVKCFNELQVINTFYVK